MTDLEKAYKALAGKQKTYDLLWAYYDGDHPLVYSTKRLQEIFHKIDAHFSENWCAVVIDAALDRMELNKFTVEEGKAAELLDELVESTELMLDDETVHTAMLVCGESFVIVWKDGEDELEAYYNDPRLCHVFYDPDHPRKKQFAAKWWVDDDEKRRITLYYEDRLEYYVSKGKAESITSVKTFIPADPPVAENPFGEIPVFHFQKERRGTISDLKNVKEPQDAVNKLFSDMMVAAEFGAFRQRYVISNSETVPQLRNAPNEVWDLPAGAPGEQPTTVGDFAETQLGMYLDAMDRIAGAVAIISRTPKHYLYKQGGDPSGEALIALEAPLISKVQRYIERVIPRWREVAAFMLKISGVEVDTTTIEPVFSQPHTVQPKAAAEIGKMRVESGMPLRTVLRRFEGWSEADLEMLEIDVEEEKSSTNDNLAAAMLANQSQFNAGMQTTP